MKLLTLIYTTLVRIITAVNITPNVRHRCSGIIGCGCNATDPQDAFRKIAECSKEQTNPALPRQETWQFNILSAPLLLLLLMGTQQRVYSALWALSGLCCCWWWWFSATSACSTPSKT
ncbi:unnamed protein product [Ceratitis capitata]|uniref:(Mediterranean fruit fly) hypothetical protein n=1 Tax=Ceratitis capitata TaxID=7213 RepID=A0A811UXF0_CERCA|nr:unnamed protein product [Ceratitis capitata]